MFDLMERSKGQMMPSFPFDMKSLMDQWFIRSPFGERNRQYWWPPMNVAETKERFTITAELPGMEAKDVAVSFEGGVLTIRGEKKAEHEEKNGDYHHVERRYGTFARSLRLPNNIEPDKIKAKHKDGVLTLTIPKAKESVGKQIEIKTE